MDPYRTFSSSLGSGCSSVMDDQETEILQVISSLDNNPLINDNERVSLGLDDKSTEKLLEDNDIGHTFDEKVDTRLDIGAHDISMKDETNIEFSSRNNRSDLKTDTLMMVNNNHRKEGQRNLEEDYMEYSNGGVITDGMERKKKKKKSFKLSATNKENKFTSTDVSGSFDIEENFQNNTTSPSFDPEFSNSTSSKSNFVQPISGYVVYVVNLSHNTTNKQLEELFSECGTVKKVYIPLDRDTKCARGFGFVTMSTMEEMYKAIEVVNGTELLGRTIYVKEAKSTRMTDSLKLYVGNISFDTTKEVLKDFFGQYGFVRDVFIPVNHVTNHPRGFAFITMNSKDAKKAIECADGVNLMGRTLEVNKSLPRGQKAQTKVKKQEVKIYIGNLAFDADGDNLHTLFEIYGNILDMYFPIDQYTGKTRGFAFVTMEPDNAVKAIESLDGYELDGRKLRVNEARPKFHNGSNNRNLEAENINSDGIRSSGNFHSNTLNEIVPDFEAGNTAKNIL